mgnify:CR=1 FL=1
MTCNCPDTGSPFLAKYIPELLSRFSLCYAQDDSCIEYFLMEKSDLRPVSKNLILSHELFSKSLYVSRFYPELYREIGCKYLSAACFYLLAHHAAGRFHLADNCCVNLEAECRVYEQFYSKLSEFDFKVCYNRPCGRAYIRGHYHVHPFDTGMITRCPLSAEN